MELIKRFRRPHFITALVLVLLVMGYQNCSNTANMNFSSTGQQKGDGIETILADENLLPDDQPDGQPTPPPSQDDEDQDDSNMPPSTDDPPEQEDEYYVAECNRLDRNIRSAVALADGSDLRDVTGNFAYKAKSVGQIVNVKGNIKVIASAANAKIAAVDSSIGNIMLCGFDVAKIQNYSRGNLIVVNGDVGDIDGFTGQLRVIGGRVTGSVKNASGTIKESP